MIAGSTTIKSGSNRAQHVRDRRARQDQGYERRPVRRKSTRNPRRRVDFSLPVATGAEVQLPAIPVMRSGMRVFAALLLIAVTALTVQLLTSSTYMLIAPEVRGLKYLSVSEVRSLAQLDGYSLFSLDPQAVAAELEGFPEILSAEVHLAWPNRVVIEIIERTPVVGWQEDGREWWLSADGTGYLQQGSLEGMLKVSCVESALQIGTDPLEPVMDAGTIKAFVVLQQLLPAEPEFIYDLRYGIGYIDEQGWQVYFGDGERIQDKVVLYQAIILDLEKKGQRPEFVSVEQLSTPYYR